MSEDAWITVTEGESAESIAYAHGHFVETVWNHAENATLRDERSSPHILKPGDRVFVPAIEPKTVAVKTGARHRFRRRGVPSRLVFQLHAVAGEILADLPYRLELPDRIETGVTGADGTVALPVMPDAGDAKLTVDPDGRCIVVALHLRQLHPATATTGVQQRLRNLGYYAGACDGVYGQLTIRAVQMFQLVQALDTTGDVDDATRAALVAAHGC